ncbi:MAG: hypothetical protein ACREOO_13540 [bacterium]
MRTLVNLFLALNLAALLFSPATSRAQKVTIDNVKAATQMLANDDFQLHFEFDLPDFDKAAPEKINIVYAVLAFEVDVLATDAGALNMLEALVSAPSKSSPQADLAYNAYPVTVRIRREKTGIELVEVDITQVVEHWVGRGVANNGLLLVSRRNTAEKILRQGKIALGANAMPAVTIFYALTDI